MPEEPKPEPKAFSQYAFIKILDDLADRTIKYATAGGIILTAATAIWIYAVPVIIGKVFEWREPLLQVGLVALAAIGGIRLLVILGDYSMETRLHDFNRTRFIGHLGVIVLYTLLQTSCMLLAIIGMANAGIKLLAAPVWTVQLVLPTVNWFLICLAIITLGLSALISILLYSFILANSMLDAIVGVSNVQLMFSNNDKLIDANMGKLVEVLGRVVNVIKPDEPLILELQSPVTIAEPEEPPEPTKPKRSSKRK